jgi:hypothetical protein
VTHFTCPKPGKTTACTVAICLVLFIIMGVPASMGAPVKPADTSEESHRLGELMYREGLLPSGGPMEAIIKGDIPVTGTAFTCVSCHLRSGLGSKEGNVFTPPTNGAYLFNPLLPINKVKFGFKGPLRPAYTDKTLAEALRDGIDPTGRILNDVMPRYHLSDQDMAILISYLKDLSTNFSPGVSATSIHFATVITDEVNPEDRDALLVPLEKYLAYKNNQSKYYATRAGSKSGRMAEAMLVSREAAYRQLTLSRWVLKGPAETWRSQLEEYYRNDPVFALLGGISYGDWQPVHRFCEDYRIPCIFPVTDFPVISDTDWYTLYFSKGLYQEGEAAARYLNSIKATFKERPVIQIVRSSRQGEALAEGFRKTWLELGNGSPAMTMLKPGEKASGEFLHRLLSRDKPGCMVLWDGPDALDELESLAADRDRPGAVIVSSSYVGKGFRSLPEQTRSFTYLTWPYRLPRDEANFKGVAEAFIGINAVRGDAQRVAKQVYIAAQVLSQAIMDMNGSYYRDNLLDVVGMASMNFGGMMGNVLPDQLYPLYERLSFRPPWLL